MGICESLTPYWGLMGICESLTNYLGLMGICESLTPYWGLMGICESFTPYWGLMGICESLTNYLGLMGICESLTPYCYQREICESLILLSLHPNVYLLASYFIVVPLRHHTPSVSIKGFPVNEKIPNKQSVRTGNASSGLGIFLSVAMEIRTRQHSIMDARCFTARTNELSPGKPDKHKHNILV
ncbi:hypothetical protein RRG08_005703 [Elysia crispata]|uniref:Uncharacterized protein n=1 Tax=Elysia crispata TaxID=231223 RepID=A0AAE0YD50_9GAST|nr:hypothetical protein RRG08_005703 [Elysia crispata]